MGEYFEDQITDSSAFQREFGFGPILLGLALDAAIDWYGYWPVSQ